MCVCVFGAQIYIILLVAPRLAHYLSAAVPFVGIFGSQTAAGIWRDSCSVDCSIVAYAPVRTLLHSGCERTVCQWWVCSCHTFLLPIVTLLFAFILPFCCGLCRSYHVSSVACLLRSTHFGVHEAWEYFSSFTRGLSIFV